MPHSHRRRLYSDRLQQLISLGLTMPPEYGSIKNQIPGIVVEHVGSPIDSPVIDLPGGRTLYLIWLSLVAQRPGVRLYDYRIEPPWPDDNFEPLPTFAESHAGLSYGLPGGWAYPRENILNLNFLKTGWRLPWTRVEGLLCALSTTAIPDQFKHGALIPVGVRFFNRAGHQLAQTMASLWADRLTHHPVTARHASPERGAALPVVSNEVADPGTAWTPLSSVFDEIEGNDVPAVQPSGTATSPAATVREGVAGSPDHDGRTEPGPGRAPLTGSGS